MSSSKPGHTHTTGKDSLQLHRHSWARSISPTSLDHAPLINHSWWSQCMLVWFRWWFMVQVVLCALWNKCSNAQGRTLSTSSTAEIMNSLATLGILVFLSSSLLLTEASEEYNYVVDEDELNSIPGEFFPFCVEVSSVWPLPNSILKPTYIQPRDVDPGRLHYLFRVQFSRPVSISNNDTSAGWQPEIVNMPANGGWLRPIHESVAKAIKEGKYNLEKVAPIFLSPSQTSTKQRYYASRIVSWHGSSKEFLVYFNVPGESRGPNLTLSK